MMDRDEVYGILALLGSVVSCICGIINLLVIYDMRVWNSCIFLITLMTIFQLVYDVSFYPSVTCTVDTFCDNISDLLQIYGGITQAIVSNEIAFLMYYTISYQKTFDVMKNKLIVLSIANIPSLLSSLALITYLINGDINANYFSQQSYFYIRLISIFVIIITCSLTLFTAWKITVGSDGRIIQANLSKAIWALSRRLLYYPLVQVLARVGFSYYEIQFGFDFDLTSASDAQFAAQCFFVITTPFGAVGYFIIFLVMQPHAWNYLKSRLLTGKRYVIPVRKWLSSEFASNVQNPSEVRMFSVTRMSDMNSVWMADRDSAEPGGIGALDQGFDSKRGSSIVLIDFNELDDEELFMCITTPVKAPIDDDGCRISSMHLEMANSKF